MSKLSTITWVAGLAFSMTANAEIAALCGNLRAIQANEKNAIVHVVFDSEAVRSAREVKFFLRLGVPLKVLAAKSLRPESIGVRTDQGSYLFKNLSYCEEGGVSVVVNGKSELPCSCYSD